MTDLFDLPDPDLTAELLARGWRRVALGGMVWWRSPADELLSQEEAFQRLRREREKKQEDRP